MKKTSKVLILPSGARGLTGRAQALQFFGTVTNAFSTNTQLRFASVVLDSVLGPPRLARHTLRCPCFSESGSKGRDLQGPFKGHYGSSKSPSRVRDGDEGVAGRNRRE